MERLITDTAGLEEFRDKVSKMKKLLDYGNISAEAGIYSEWNTFQYVTKQLENSVAHNDVIKDIKDGLTKTNQRLEENINTCNSIIKACEGYANSIEETISRRAKF